MEKIFVRRLFGVIVLAVLVVAPGAPSFAQEAPEEEQPGVPEEEMEVVS